MVRIKKKAAIISGKDSTAVLVVNTVLYFSLFGFFGELTWFITLLTGVMVFALITVFNKKGKGNMFDRPKENKCPSIDGK